MTYLVGCVLLFGAIFLNRELATSLINTHSLGIVIGGTLVVTLMLAPTKALRDSIRVFWQSVSDVRDMEKDLLRLASNRHATVSDPYGLIAYARDLWEMGLSGNEFEIALRTRAETMLTHRITAAACLRNLGKYPPALGMIGTVIGMIELFGSLGKSANAQSSIGMQLALAMTATLYGLILSNLILLPLADRLEANDEERRILMDNTLKIIFSHNRKEPKFVTERIMAQSGGARAA